VAVVSTAAICTSGASWSLPCVPKPRLLAAWQPRRRRRTTLQPFAPGGVADEPIVCRAADGVPAVLSWPKHSFGLRKLLSQINSRRGTVRRFRPKLGGESPKRSAQMQQLRMPHRSQTTIRSWPTMISPRKYFATGMRQMSSVKLSIAGVRCDSTRVLTPASCAIRPTSSEGV
jgi:hypothetical protein